MPRNYHLCAPPCSTRRRCAESRFSARVAGENELARAHRHAVQLGRIVQAKQPALHPMTCCKFTHYRSNVPPRPLHSAGRVQLWEESKKHASSLPITAPENKNVLARGFRRALDGGMVAYNLSEIGEMIEINVSWVRCAVVQAETVIYCGGLRAGVARGLHVYFGIADDQGLARGNS